YGVMYDPKYVNGILYVIDYGNMIEYYDGVSWTHVPIAYGYSSNYVYDYCITATGIVYFVNDEDYSNMKMALLKW
ncbi:MAG: hypothetical protein ACHQFW_10255, partial [Chitinophagales bacterium]